jgi:hypothetical protein
MVLPPLERLLIRGQEIQGQQKFGDSILISLGIKYTVPEFLLSLNFLSPN